MNNTFIQLGDRILDFFPNTVVSITKQILDMKASNQRSVSLTNSFKIPPTPNNLIALGFPNSEFSESSLPYDAGTCKVIISGIESMTNAVLVVNGITDDQIDIVIYDQALQFFDVLDAMGNVNDYDFGYYMKFRNADFLTNKLATSGIVTPVINHGRIYPAPVQTLENYDFDAQLEPWENVGDTGLDWVYDGTGTPGVKAIGLVTGGANATSKKLQNEYKFLVGFRYKVQLQFSYTQSTGTPNLSIGIFYDEDNSVGINVTSVGSHTEEIEIVPTIDSEIIMIQAENNSSGAGHSAIVVLQNIFITPYSVIDIKAPYYVPSLYYHSVVKKVIEEAGYSWSFDFTTAQEDFFESLAIANANTEYPESFRKIRGVLAESAGQVINISDNNEHNFLFTTVRRTDSFGFFNSGTGVYAPGTLSYNFRTNDRGYVKFAITITGTATFRVQLNTNGLFGITEVDVSSSGTYAISISTQEPGVFDVGPSLYGSGASQYMFIQRVSGAGTAAVTVEEGFLEINARNDYTEASNINVSAVCLPEMSCKQFIYDFIMRFGLLFRQTGNTITFKPIQNLSGDRANALDWTSKRHNAGQAIDFTSDYAQKNYFTDSAAESTFVTDQFLTIDNPGLQPLADYYSSLFSKVQDYSINGIQVASPKLFDEETHAIESSGGIYRAPIPTANSSPRLVKLRREAAGDPDVYYNNVLQATYFVATYAAWDDFLDMFYPWLSDAFDRYKLIERFYTLDPVDIAKVENFKLIYDNQAYYLPGKINNYINGRLTKVQLLKVS